MSDCWEYLRRYNAWRTGKDERTMEKAGITPERVTAAIREVLVEKQRLSAQLQKAWTDRARMHREMKKALSTKH